MPETPPPHTNAHYVSAALSGGVGTFQRRLLAYTGLAWAADACETMLLSYLGPSVACAWPETVGPAAESLLSSVVFAAMLFGVPILGSIADIFGRRRGFLLSAALLGAAGLASAAAPSFAALLLLRAAVGFALGGTPVAVTLFSEFLPSKQRGTMVIAMQGFWTIGTAAEALLAWAVLPTMGWRALLAMSALPLFILLAGFPWLSESPHWLAAHGRTAEAKAVLARVARVNGNEQEEHDAAREEGEGTSPPPPQRRSAKAHARHALSVIFSRKMAFTTALLWMIWFVAAMTYYGLVLLTTSLSASRSDRPRCTPDGRPNFNSSDYANVLVTAVAEAPGLLVAALFVERKGRLWVLRAGSALCAACVLGLLGVSSRAAQLALLFGARAGIEALFVVLYVITPELFPTAVRATGLALCNSFSRLGGFAAPFATVYLVESGRQGAAEMLLGVALLGATAAAMALPVETKGVDLGAAGHQFEEGEEDGEDGDGEGMPLMATAGSPLSGHGSPLSSPPPRRID